jgi:hypothetical protein
MVMMSMRGFRLKERDDTASRPSAVRRGWSPGALLFNMATAKWSLCYAELD